MVPDAGLTRRLVAFVRAFTGGDGAEVVTLAGDASARRYHRVRAGGRPASVVVMEVPARDTPPPAPPTTWGAPAPGALGSVPELAFLDVHRYLERHGFPVPAVYRHDLEAGFVALEDLGDLSFEAAAKAAGPRARRRLYERALALVTELQRIGRSDPDERCVAFRRRFDEALLRWELDHFREWFLERDRHVRLAPAEVEALDRGFALVSERLAALPPVLAHRDFQSRNLLLSAPPGADGSAGELRVIDFQDALLGPPVYDLVALLRDSYIELPGPEVHELLDGFSPGAGDMDARKLRELFHLQTVQRKLKDAGRFVFLSDVRGLSYFRDAIPSSLRYAGRALVALPDLAGVREVLERHIPELRADAGADLRV